MPKDTKSSGYNKAPACESRGFGHKKEGENFDTPSSLLCLPICLRFCKPVSLDSPELQLIQRNKKLITYAKQNIQKAQIFLRKQKFHR